MPSAIPVSPPSPPWDLADEASLDHSLNRARRFLIRHPDKSVSGWSEEAYSTISIGPVISRSKDNGSLVNVRIFATELDIPRSLNVAVPTS